MNGAEYQHYLQLLDLLRHVKSFLETVYPPDDRDEQFQDELDGLIGEIEEVLNAE